jgi:hypothetical protein
MESFSINDLQNSSIDYKVLFETKVCKDNTFPERCVAPAYQAGLVTHWLSVHPEKAALTAAFRKAKIGDFTGFPQGVYAMLRAAFPALASNNFIGVGAPAVHQTGIDWIRFPFEAPIGTKSPLDGAEFSSNGVSLPAGTQNVCGVIVPDHDKINKDLLIASVEFCQLVTPVESKKSVEWVTPSEVDSHKKIGVSVSGRSGGVDLTLVVDPPEPGQLKDSSVLCYVYDTMKEKSVVEQLDFAKSVTVAKWSNTCAHSEYSTVYKPKRKTNGYLTVEGRDDLYSKPVSAGTDDSVVYRLVDDLNARSNSTKMMGCWYFGLSLQQPVKAVLEACASVRKIGVNCDIANLSHGMMFAATWDASKFPRGPNLISSMVLPDSSVITSRDVIERDENFIPRKEVYIDFHYKCQSSVNLKMESDVRKTILLKELVSIIAESKNLGHRFFFFRLPLVFLDLGYEPEFQKTGCGFFCDVDPISGFIWFTNDDEKFVKDSNGKFIGGEKMRELIRRCIGARYMVNQTNVSCIEVCKRFPDKIKFSFGYQVSKKSLKVDFEEMTKVDEKLPFANIISTTRANVFDHLIAPKAFNIKDVVPKIDGNSKVEPEKKKVDDAAVKTNVSSSLSKDGSSGDTSIWDNV